MLGNLSPRPAQNLARKQFVPVRSFFLCLSLILPGSAAVRVAAQAQEISARTASARPAQPSPPATKSAAGNASHPANPPSDEQISEAAEGAVRIAGLRATGAALTTSRRADLEERLLAVNPGTPLQDVRIFEMESPAPAAFDDRVSWIVAVAGSAREVYELYGFDPAREPQASSPDFSRLIAQFAPAISNKNAASLAGFFLGCCVGAERSEIVASDEEVRHSVERNYDVAYGDVWRALAANSQWAQLYSQDGPHDLVPAVRASNGRYRVDLKRMAMRPGSQPQLQDWSVEVSLDGSVRVLNMRPIFPRTSRWMFFDSGASAAPLSPPLADACDGGHCEGNSAGPARPADRRVLFLQLLQAGRGKLGALRHIHLNHPD